MFKLHKMLEKDCIRIAENNLNLLLLMNDINFPWFILVPKRGLIKEIFQLDLEDQIEFQKQSVFLSEVLYNIFKADKMNIAALGNMCPQLHVHHIVRYETDKIWPEPIWGKVEVKKYTEEQLNKLINTVKPELETIFKF